MLEDLASYICYSFVKATIEYRATFQEIIEAAQWLASCDQSVKNE